MSTKRSDRKRVMCPTDVYHQITPMQWGFGSHGTMGPVKYYWWVFKNCKVFKSGISSSWSAAADEAVKIEKTIRKKKKK